MRERNYDDEDDDDSSFSPKPDPPSSSYSSSLTPARPSSAHKQGHGSRALHRRVPSLSNYAATNISKLYGLNNQILAAFEANFEAKMYSVAYAIGLQFVETALLEIPKHGYFYSPRHETERMESSLQAVSVTRKLQKIQNELGNVYSEDLERIQRLNLLAKQQVEQASEDQYESQRARTEQDLRASSSNMADWVVLDPFLQCQESLSSIFCPNPANGVPSPETIPVSSGRRTAQKPTRDLLDRDVPAEEESPPWSREYSEPREEAPYVREADLLGLDATVPSDTEPRRPSWSIPPAGMTSDNRSWAQPPPLLAQENSAIPTQNTPAPRTSRRRTPDLLKTRPTTSMGSEIATLPPRPRQRPKPEATDEDWMVVQYKQPSTTTSSASSSSRSRPALEGSFSNLVSQKSHRHIDTEEEIMLERALFISGLEVVEAPSADSSTHSDSHKDEPRPPAIRLSSSSRLQFGTLAALYHEDFDHLVKTKRIRITTIATYQGRVPESTNGCTVIAPLLCMHHLLNDEQPDTGVLDSGVSQVIDQETPVILGDLRQQLGLADQAFLIPSDVHDYLIGNGQFHQSQFIDVMGGNMLQEAHLENFVSALANPNLPKLAATLFFHEHVICILKLHRGNDMFWYDVVDSLPLPETLMLADESEDAFHRRFGIHSDDPELEHVLVPFSVRLRCMDSEALQACLRWYACSKFTDENIRYIDQYEFDEHQSSFDPRVFQAFLWGSPQV